MDISGWVMMVLVLGGIWGGFVYLLRQSTKQD